MPRKKKLQNDNRLTVSVVGAGYVGLVTGACLAYQGHKVTIIEIDNKTVGLLEKGCSPISEPGLEELLKKYLGKSIFIRTDFISVPESDITLICVGTPSNPDGSVNLSFIESACISIGSALIGRTSYSSIVVKSTVPPGTTEKLIREKILETSHKTDKTIGFAMNPEFLREGNAIEDFLHPDRIIIGTSDARTEEHVAALYRGISGPVIFTGITTAEMIKYASNAFLASKISFANEIGNLCKHLDIDVYEVMKGVGADSRIGPLFLNAGAGFGGSCFPKDISALISLAKELGENPLLLQSVLTINEQQPHRMVALLEEKVGSVKGKRISILGLAFKDNTDDIRDSRAIPVIQELLQKGAQVVAYDPLAISNMQQIFPTIEYCTSARETLTGSEGCLVMTEWPEFSRLDKEFDLMAHRIIIEGRRILSCKDIDGICW